MKHFFHRSLAAAALGAVLAAAAIAQTPQRSTALRLQSITNAVEAVAGMVTLPSVPGGTLVMAVCHECAPQSFTVDTTTEYFIGDKPVTLAELRAAVAAAPGNTLTVSYVIETGVVTQISAVP